MTLRSCAVIACALLVGSCSKKSAESTHTPEPPTAKGGGARAEVPLRATFEGRALTFAYGKAFERFGGLHVVLSTAATSCDAPPSDDAVEIELDVPPGPNQDFFAGSKIGVEVWMRAPKAPLRLSHAAAYQTSLALEAFARKEGAHVRGTLEFSTKYAETTAGGGKQQYAYDAGGGFDAQLCRTTNGFVEAEGGAHRMPSREPASGTYDGEAFVYKSALATVYEDTFTGERYVQSLALYPIDVRCDDRFAREGTTRFLLLKEIGGAGNRVRLDGFQPADAFVSTPEQAEGDAKAGAVTRAFGAPQHAYVSFDSLDFRPNTKITGRVFADGGAGAKPHDAGTITGTFVATVCVP